MSTPHRRPKKRTRSLAYTGLAILFAAAGLAAVAYLENNESKPSAFCYIKNQVLECINADGNIARTTPLPKLDGNLISALTPAPDQSFYLASNNGPGNNTHLHDNAYILDKDFKVIKHLDNLIVQDYDLISAAWSHDSKLVAIKSVYGNLAVFDTAAKTQHQATNDTVDFYGFSRNNRLVYSLPIISKTTHAYTKNSRLHIANADGSNTKIIANTPGIYAGSYALSRDDIVVYHSDTETYAVNLDKITSQKPQKLNIDPYSYFRYDKATDRLYFVYKTKLGPEKDGVGSISYATVSKLLEGAGPTNVILNSAVSAKATPFVIPYAANRIVLANDWQDHRAVMYDLSTGRQVTTISLPNQYGDGTADDPRFQDTVPLIVGPLRTK